MKARQLLRKKPAFQTESAIVLADLKKTLHLSQLEALVIYEGFDIFDAPEAQLDALTWQVLGDPTTDTLVNIDEVTGDLVLALEYLPGQFDQRADAAEQAAKLLSDDFMATRLTSFKMYAFTGALSAQDKDKITHYLLNPVDSRLKELSQLSMDSVSQPEPVSVLEGFRQLDSAGLKQQKTAMGLSLTDADMACIQRHFQSIQRDPTDTEIRVLDTYWSDHCRHTTFLTQLKHITFPQDALGARLQASFDDYLRFRQEAGIADRPITLMDLATINARSLRKQGKLDSVEISDEINACSVFIDVEEDGKCEKWLLQFKNETHNHPTEIEPFGGASTCLGGAIRDPLSGRAFVYQAMRVTGSGNPLAPVEETLAGKLPQYKITKGAAHGYSSYGNQIGVATTQVAEIYHEGYRAKRMEVGAVVAAVPAENVVRAKPAVGDKIILLGGKTGRDGCGGASGSSKAHTAESLAKSGAEVQKGNPPVERALQRLFRQPEVAKKIKKCNDFGAGGVCVAIGELADSLLIDLDKVPTKYAGLSGTELTISESQERMAVVVAPEDVDFFIAECEKENTLAVVVAEVTDSGAMIITHRGQEIVHLSRDFIDSAGAEQYQAQVKVAGELTAESPFAPQTHDANSDLLARLRELNNASQRGLQDMFDSNVGASTVLLPYGGKTQNAPAEGSVQLLPVKTLGASMRTASLMTYGFDAEVSSYSPFHGGAYAVVEAVARQVALGADISRIHLSLQEYFEKLGDNADKWGKPFAALLGAFSAAAGFDLAAIGGKDSMSGSFGDLHVPPTLIAFAVSHANADSVISSELKAAGNYLYLLKHQRHADNTPDFAQLKQNFTWFAAQRDHIVSAMTVKHSGAAVELAKSALGNRIGFDISGEDEWLFANHYGSLIIESRQPLSGDNLVALGRTTEDDSLCINGKPYALSAVLTAYEQTLAPVFPLYPEVQAGTVDTLTFEAKPVARVSRLSQGAKPRVFIPVFPGMNSEYDMANAFERNGAVTQQLPFVNLSQAAIHQSLDAFCGQLQNSQILALSGGFSAGDEPNGSGKYIAMVLKNAQIRTAIGEFLARDGLIVGICNGFQALVKSGLLPYGEVRNRAVHDVTLEHNNSHRHIARIAQTRICHVNSPWLADFTAGDIHDVAFSHGEGRFVADEAQLKALIANGQIATQYVNTHGQASLHPADNPNGSTLAIEGLTSPDGRILGKMGHSERYAQYCYLNYPHFRAQNIFASGVKAFK